jgi:hypothetical protein
MHPGGGKGVESSKHSRRTRPMRHHLFSALIVVLGLGLGTALPAEAKTGGCVKDGAVGAVAGHFVGSGHAAAGAAAGCAVGVHRRHAAEKRDVQQQQQPAAQPNH